MLSPCKHSGSGVTWEPEEEQVQQRGKENKRPLALVPPRPETVLSAFSVQGLDAVGLWCSQEDHPDFCVLPLGTWTQDSPLRACTTGSNYSAATTDTTLTADGIEWSLCARHSSNRCACNYSFKSHKKLMR